MKHKFLSIKELEQQIKLSHWLILLTMMGATIALVRLSFLSSAVYCLGIVVLLCTFSCWFVICDQADKIRIDIRRSKKQ